MAKKKSSKGSLLRVDSSIAKAMVELKKVIMAAELTPKRLRKLRSKLSKLAETRVGIAPSRSPFRSHKKKTSRKKGSRKAARKTSRKAARRTSRKSSRRTSRRAPRKSSRRRTSRRR